MTILNNRLAIVLRKLADKLAPIESLDTFSSFHERDAALQHDIREWFEKAGR